MKKKRFQNPILVALVARHATTTTVMKDRREKRGRSKQGSWRREEW